MNYKGQSGAKSNQLVILLLVVGLMAFSSAVRDLGELHQLALDTSRFVASWSNGVTPAEIPPTAVVKVETCDINKTLDQSIPPVELSWLENADEKTIEVDEIETPQVARRSRVQIVRPARTPRIDFDPVQLEVRVPSDADAEADATTPSEFPQFTFKTKTRKHNVIRISPRDREMLLKTLNRSINLRIAS